jgi:hypothetical protein
MTVPYSSENDRPADLIHGFRSSADSPSRKNAWIDGPQLFAYGLAAALARTGTLGDRRYP